MKRNLEKLKHTCFDLLIIGGGITGSAIAWDASLRGYSVAVIEKKDFGHATSMATSKLIHGGLRYLENFDFGLVRESLRERRHMSNMVPHQIRPLPFLMPMYDMNIVSKYYLKAGLSLYDMLSFDKNLLKEKSNRLENHRWLSTKEALEHEPSLTQEKLSGAFFYYDLQSIHPERINIDFLLSASSHGAIVSNYLQVSDIMYNKISEQKKICGVKVKNQLENNEEFMISSKTIVNCSGPWIQTTLDKIELNVSHKVVLSKGIHLLMPKRQRDQAIFITTKDNKHLLILPWLNYTLLGTTDTEYDGSPDEVSVSKEEAKNFLGLINEYYPVNYQFEDIIHSYSGLRVLVIPTYVNKEKTYKISRRPEIIDHEQEGMSGLISVVGGKYTTSRGLAERVVDHIQKQYQLGSMFCRTKTVPLASASYNMSLDKYREETQQIFGKKYSLEFLSHLIEYYGVYSRKILSLMEGDKFLEQKIDPSSCRVFAEIEYAIQEESALTLSDMLYRRCGWGNEGLKTIPIVRAIAEYMGTSLDWSSQHLEKEVSEYLRTQKFYG